MKILSLKFMNLNSLYGEWSIDFTRPEYADNGLFAIVGPTGSGKSTIMDAISLALYGETPRLGKITSGSNEILSRQTGECYAEVVFESQSGRYRCQWRQHRARKRADGKLAEASHEISDAITGKLLENKKREVAILIEEKTGMNFERFTRSILLAQGSFAAFLKASPDERSPILEQITGTEIYSDISIAVHERQRVERQALERLQEQIQGVLVLSDAEEAQLSAELEQLAMQEKDLAEKQKDHAAGLAWYEKLANLEQELTNLSDEKDQLDQENQAASTMRQMLAAALRAQPLDSDYSSLVTIRFEQQKDQLSLAEIERVRPEIEQAASASQAAHVQADTDLQAAQAVFAASQPVLQMVRRQDWTIASQMTAVAKLDEIVKRQSDQIEKARQDLELEHASHSATLKNQAALARKMEQTAADEPLVTQIAGIAARFMQIRGILDDIHNRESELEAIRSVASQEASSLHQFEQDAKQLEQQIHLEQTALEELKVCLQTLLMNRTLGDYRTELASLQKEARLVRTIIDLESERKRLVAGQPCPLCGATEHPFAQESLPEMDEIEQKIEDLTRLIDQADQYNQQMADQAQRVSVCQSSRQEVELKAQKARLDWEKQQALTEQLAREKLVQQERLQRQTADGLLLILPFGWTELPLERLDEVLNDLHLRSQARQMVVADYRESVELIEQIRHRVDLLEQRLHNLELSRVQSLGELDQARQELAVAVQERQGLFGDKNPDAEEAVLQKTIQTAILAEKKSRENVAEQIRILADNQSSRQILSAQLADRQKRLSELEMAWTRQLTAAGFATEPDFLACRLPSAELGNLKSHIQALDQKRSELTIRIQDRIQQKELCLAEPKTQHSLDFLKEELEVLKIRQKEIQQKIGERLSRQADNQAAREKVAAILEQLGKQQIECKKWDRLHLLIGSSDGKKYRNFAQGLTFERMVSQANQQLMQMTDRYLLVRDTEQPLNLNVIDNYQAGEIRTTRNLSGGESFIVSLALALGLSRMASRKIRVDSLFLDEGFGTLDDEALETALETLASLQAENKLIGVISHVPALKERISTQLSIQVQAGGKSTLSGPGVERIHHLA